MSHPARRSTPQPRVVIVDAELSLNEAQWQRLLAHLSCDRVVMMRTPAEVSQEDLADVEIALLAKDRADLPRRAAQLRWVHCDQSGLSNLARRDILGRMAVTGAAGRSADALAEHALMFALMLAFDVPAFSAAQHQHRWRRDPGMADLRPLAGRTMGVIGLGNTGQALALRAQALGLFVLGYRRGDGPVPAGVTRVFCRARGETIDPVVAQSDILVLTLRLSDQTRGMIGREQLKRMKPSAFLINLSRGEIIDQDALLWALEQRVIAGAGLDVTTPEPLPAGHPLWDAPNTLITPHFTPVSPERAERSLQIIIENLDRYRRGESLLNQLSVDDAWSGPR